MNSLLKWLTRHPFADEQALVKVKVDGHEREVKVCDLVRSYQKCQAADNRLREAALLLKAAKH